MDYLVYFIIAIGATTAGAMTGMGGGVIIKPVLDVMNQYDVATIGMLSCITVFVMSMVSIGKQIQQKVHVDVKMALPLAIGSVLGGNIGQAGLSAVIQRVGNNSTVVAVQNIVLATLIVFVFLYMINKSKIRTLGMSGILPALLVGVLLGVFSSFLGIGGGPINVALLIFLFSFDTKTATVYSIITILFAQMSKLVMVVLTTGFAEFDLSMLLPMVIGAVAGGFIGSWLNKKLPEKAVDAGFNAVQVLVFIICVFNIVRSIMPA